MMCYVKQDEDIDVQSALLGLCRLIRPIITHTFTGSIDSWSLERRFPIEFRRNLVLVPVEEWR